MMMANMGYAYAQLAKNAAKGNKSVLKWEKLMHEHALGHISAGSREPVQGTPAWVTLEVANGGFATGGLLAGGDLQQHEIDLLNELGEKNTADVEHCRLVLNQYFLSGPGLSILEDMLEKGTYEIHVPEEAALLAVCWMMGHGHEDEARSVVDVLSPWFSRLRFYPVPSPRPLSSGALVNVASVWEVVANLGLVKVSLALMTLSHALGVTLPIYDKLVALVMATSDDPSHPPTFSASSDTSSSSSSSTSSSSDGQVKDQTSSSSSSSSATSTPTPPVQPPRRSIEGGTPFTITSISPELKEQFAALQKEIEGMKPQSRRMKHGMGRLYKSTRRFFASTDTAPQYRDQARLLLAQINQKRGLPGSERAKTLRAMQAKIVESTDSGPAQARIVQGRLANCVQKEGLEDVDAVLGLDAGGGAWDEASRGTTDHREHP
eukprot:TRINITY_DN7997_c0_g2_i1.p1 TRINITY_DN7997_c0_g2~~TRINITY_DN7997_c0_g2_i1.p1  ORF type:complete len:434 (+),score=89.46 TRINITY_DN7997_c0_g2_i1:27-1328(+)